MSHNFSNERNLEPKLKTEGENVNHGFKSALFINPLNYDSGQIQEVQERIENLNVCSDPHFSGKTPKSLESMNFKNCLSSDLLKRLDENSPINSKRTMKRQPSDIYLTSEKSENINEDVENRPTNSLFYVKNNPKNESFNNNQIIPQDEFDKEDSEKFFQYPTFKTKNNINQMEYHNIIQDNLEEGNLKYQNRIPFQAYSGYTKTKDEMARHSMEHSISLTPENRINYQTYNNALTYKDLLNKKYNQKILFNSANSDKVNREPTEWLSCQSTDNTDASKRLSPYNEDISFFPKNFVKNLNMNNYFNQNQDIYDNNQVFKMWSNKELNIDNDHPKKIHFNKNDLKKKVNINWVQNELQMQQNKNSILQRQYSMEHNNKALNKQFMYGNTGWVCSLCKNFNYEVRVKCNRCGKPKFQNLVQCSDNNNNINNLNTLSNQLRVNLNNPNPLNYGNEESNYKIPEEKLLYHSTRVENFPHINNNKDNDINVNENYNNSNINNIKLIQAGEKDIPINSIANELSNFHNSPTEMKTGSTEGKKKKKPFVERAGDWVCIKCKNLNFSFRTVCNRCQLTKIESDHLFEQYMKNLMNYMKINEILQNQILNNQNNKSDTVGNMNNNPNYSNINSNMYQNRRENIENAYRQVMTSNIMNLDNPGNMNNIFSSNSDTSSERSRALNEENYLTREFLNERLGNNNSK